MRTMRSIRGQVRFGLAGAIAAAGLLLAAPAARADSPPVSVTVSAPLPAAFCELSFCYVTVSGSWTVSPIRVPTVSAMLVRT